MPRFKRFLKHVLKSLVDFLNSWQLKKCVCLEKIPELRSREANDCSLSCSIKANLTFQNECGGNKTYSLFKSGTFFMIYYCMFLTELTLTLKYDLKF